MFFADYFGKMSCKQIMRGLIAQSKYQVILFKKKQSDKKELNIWFIIPRMRHAVWANKLYIICLSDIFPK